MTIRGFGAITFPITPSGDCIVTTQFPSNDPELFTQKDGYRTLNVHRAKPPQQYTINIDVGTSRIPINPLVLGAGNTPFQFTGTYSYTKLGRSVTKDLKLREGGETVSSRQISR